MKRVFVILIILMLIFIPCVSAKKPDNPQDNSKFKHKDVAVTLSAYEILSTGGLGDTLNINNPKVDSSKAIHFIIVNGSDTKTKKIYVHRKSSVIISNDSTIVMQTSKFKNIPTLELYYGYSAGLLSPWAHYYRVGDCDVTCPVARADFITRTIWFSTVNESDINAIVDSEIIPVYEALP